MKKLIICIMELLFAVLGPAFSAPVITADDDVFSLSAAQPADDSKLHAFSLSGAQPADDRNLATDVLQERVLQAALHLSGASSVEELDESEMERYLVLARHPLKINYLSRSRLLSSGLFSSFQVASLLDYRARSGDVLSRQELSLVDGFASDARYLSVFLDFEAAGLPGSSRDTLIWDNDLLLRLALREGEYAGALKYSLSVGQTAEAALAMRKSYDAPFWPPERTSAAVAYYGRGTMSKILIGNLNARFGQGLAMWSGFTMSGFSSARSFSKHPSGISLSRSFSPQLTGVGAELTFGRTALSALASREGIAAANLTFFGRMGQFGLTGALGWPEKIRGATLAADTRFCVGKTDIFGELAYGSGGIAAVAGVTYNPEYACCISFLGRYYPSGYYAPLPSAARSSSKSENEAGAAVGIDWRSLNASFDFAWHPKGGKRQMKALLSYQHSFSDRLSLNLRSSLRYRPEETYPLRADFRLDGDYSLKGLGFRLRMDCLHCQSWSFLSYVETGYKKAFFAYLRATLFQVDDWDDRIYVYERDVPGSFSSVAVYGRGYSLSLYTGYKARIRSFSAGIYLRASAVRYHWSSTSGRAPSAELKTQLMIGF